MYEINKSDFIRVVIPCHPLCCKWNGRGPVRHFTALAVFLSFLYKITCRHVIKLGELVNRVAIILKDTPELNNLDFPALSEPSPPVLTRSTLLQNQGYRTVQVLSNCTAWIRRLDGGN